MKSIYDIRRAQLKKLIDEQFEGKASLFAAATPKIRSDASGVTLDASYVSRMLYPETKDGFKRIGEPMARHIEVTHGIEKYWMDGEQPGAGLGLPSHQGTGHVSRLDRLKGKASPRSLALLERLEAAIVRGTITEDDLALLEQTAAHIEKIRPTKD